MDTDVDTAHPFVAWESAKERDEYNDNLIAAISKLVGDVNDPIDFERFVVVHNNVSITLSFITMQMLTHLCLPSSKTDFARSYGPLEERKYGFSFSQRERKDNLSRHCAAIRT